MVPADSFLGRYLRLMSALETPVAYDFWCGLWTLSSVLGRDSIVARPRIPVYLNLYVFIISESGLTRKTTAVTRAKKVLRKYDEVMREMNPGWQTSFALFKPDVHLPFIIDDKTTPEQFEALIHGQSVCYGTAFFAIGIDELIRFLGRERYKMALPGLLTDLYDCPSYRRGPGTIKHGETVMQDVFVSLLGASTASWLVGAINPDVIEGGFTSRVVYVHEEARKKLVPWPEEPSEDEPDELTLATVLAAIKGQQLSHDYCRNIELTPKAIKFLKRWYTSRDEHHDPFNSSWDAREDEHVLRIAALLAANDMSWLISVPHLQKAMKLTKIVRDAGSSLFSGTIRTDPLAVAVERLRTMLLEAGKDPLSQGFLYSKMKGRIEGKTLKKLLALMHEHGYVQQFVQATGQQGRPKTLWRATELLANQGVTNLILEGMER